jgi:hypothetical protein
LDVVGTALVEKDEQVSEASQESRALSPHHRFMIAFHSPDGVNRTAQVPCGENVSNTSRQHEGEHFLWSGLKAKGGNYAHFPQISELSRPISPHCRLVGSPNSREMEPNRVLAAGS